MSDIQCPFTNGSCHGDDCGIFDETIPVDTVLGRHGACAIYGISRRLQHIDSRLKRLACYAEKDR